MPHSPKKYLSLKYNDQSGAVWIEFLVASSALLISLFILVPILAKITDVRHKTEQSAQYAVWERSVGYQDVENIGAPEKSDDTLINEARHRVLADGNTLVFAGQSSGAMEIDSFHYFLDGQSNTQDYTSLLGSRSSTPDKSLTLSVNNSGQPRIELINGSTGAFDLSRSIVPVPSGLLLSLSDQTKVNNMINPKGYYHSNAQLVVKRPSWFSAFTNDNATMDVSKSLLVDGWGAGGFNYNRRQVNKLQPKGFTENRFAKYALNLYKGAFTKVPRIANDLNKLNFDHVDSEQLLNPSHQLGAY